MSENEEIKEPYTWAKLKEFCNSLADYQLQQEVKVIQEDSVMTILDASEIGSDHYKFEDEDYSITKDDFDKDYHLEGKYQTLDEALANEPYVLTLSTNIYLYEDF